MSEYVTICPKCAQQILGDTAYTGKRVACPVCLKEITLPKPVQLRPGAAPTPAQSAPDVTFPPQRPRSSHWPVVVAAISVALLAAGGVFAWVKSASAAAAKAAPAAPAAKPTMEVSAAAKRITWLPPAPITTAEAALLLRGEIVAAVGFGLEEPRTVTLASLKIPFAAASDTNVASTTGYASTASDQWHASASIPATGNRDFDTVLNGFNYDGGPKTITIHHLIPGRQYAVQLFALDDRTVNDAKTRTAWFADALDPSNVSATFKMGDNVYVVGIFTATDESRQIIEALPGTGWDTSGGVGNLNALVVRLLP